MVNEFRYFGFFWFYCHSIKRHGYQYWGLKLEPMRKLQRITTTSGVSRLYSAPNFFKRNIYTKLNKKQEQSKLNLATVELGAKKHWHGSNRVSTMFQTVMLQSLTRNIEHIIKYLNYESMDQVDVELWRGVMQRNGRGQGFDRYNFDFCRAVW